MNFDDAFVRLIGHEGGHVNDPRDPGGETKYGVSRRQYPGEDIAGMTLERARLLYRRDYWGPAGCDLVPDALRFELFDVGVNMGTTTAVKLLQQALDVVDDGVIGPLTLMRARDASSDWVLKRMRAFRLLAYARMKTFPTFGAGWVNRVARNMLEA